MAACCLAVHFFAVGSEGPRHRADRGNRRDTWLWLLLDRQFDRDLRLRDLLVSCHDRIDGDLVCRSPSLVSPSLCRRRSPSPLQPGIIDIVVNPLTPRIVAARPAWTREFHTKKIGRAAEESRPSRWSRCSRRWMRPGSSARSCWRASSASRARPAPGTCRTNGSPRPSRNTPRASAALPASTRPRACRACAISSARCSELGFIGAHTYPHWFELRAERSPLLSVLCQVLRARRADPDAGRAVADLLRQAPAAQRRPADLSRRHRLRFSRAQADRHPHRHSVARRDDRDGVEARQRLHRLRRAQPEILAGELPALHQHAMAGRRCCSAPTIRC